jgi:Cd2+/Zn2+-exporting ATPase
MLTGDTPGAARALAGRLGLDEVRAGLLPEDKLAAVQALVARHGAVAMVGDGVNDAPALAASSLGVALGAAGSDAAIETADVVIMSDDLSRLPWLVRHSRRTVGTIRTNVAVSLAIKAAFIVLALLGWASLWGAIAADMGVSLLVVANAMRLLRAAAPPAAQTP